ncbi:CheY-like chemotaxis protein [Paraburkholderia sp. GAS199]|uniref:histidine kinase n=1 Tax=Paraburkholderia sp. GAS199 TaxID=3035126 RepID=UPI003D1FE250
MTRRVSHDDETEFAIWKTACPDHTTAPRRVLIGHRDKAIGESLVRLLSLEGYEAVHAADLVKVATFVKWWKPDALLLDTRLDSITGSPFTRALHAEELNRGVLMLAMSNIWPLDPIATLKAAGFDGHCRRPCSLWRVVDLLEGYFASVPLNLSANAAAAQGMQRRP